MNNAIDSETRYENIEGEFEFLQSVDKVFGWRPLSSSAQHVLCEYCTQHTTLQNVHNNGDICIQSKTLQTNNPQTYVRYRASD